MTDIKNFRKELKNLGYSLKVTTNSEFKSAEIFFDGVKVNRQIQTKESIAKHSSLFNYLNNVEVRDGMFRVIF